jgi:hypothetical protein
MGTGRFIFALSEASGRLSLPEIIETCIGEPTATGRLPYDLKKLAGEKDSPEGGEGIGSAGAIQ